MVVVKNGIETKVNDLYEALDVLGRKIIPGNKKNLTKYCGRLKWDIDGVEYQRKMRDEWD
jgi:hypothetical protein